VRQEYREAVAREPAGETLPTHHRTPDRDATARNHAIAIGESGQIVDEMQAIDVAIQHRNHGARRRVALPAFHARLETAP
jgi:hypothetical protein